MQKGKPLAFYSQKMNAVQRNYTMGKQELLSIVETLKEFRNILLGHDIVVHTDHKNIVYGNLSNDRIVRWRLLLEEFGPRYEHVAGADNIVADALSRLDFQHKEEDKREVEEIRWTRRPAQILAYCMSTLESDSCETDSPEDAMALMEACFQGKKSKSSRTQEEEFPMSTAVLAREQKKDAALKKRLATSKKDFQV